VDFTELHDAITRTFAQERPDFAQGTLRKVLIVAEIATPQGTRAFVQTTTDGASRRLRTWEATGLVTFALSETLKDSNRPTEE